MIYHNQIWTCPPLSWWAAFRIFSFWMFNMKSHWERHKEAAAITCWQASMYAIYQFNGWECERNATTQAPRGIWKTIVLWNYWVKYNCSSSKTHLWPRFTPTNSCHSYRATEDPKGLQKQRTNPQFIPFTSVGVLAVLWILRRTCVVCGWQGKCRIGMFEKKLGFGWCAQSLTDPRDMRAVHGFVLWWHLKKLVKAHILIGWFELIEQYKFVFNKTKNWLVWYKLNQPVWKEIRRTDEGWSAVPHITLMIHGEIDPSITNIFPVLIGSYIHFEFSTEITGRTLSYLVC